MKHFAQRGIALLQVLLLSAVLMVMLMAIHSAVQRHLQLAESALDRAQAAMALNSAEAETLFALLTHDLRPDQNSQLALPKYWRFDNQTIQLAEVQLRIEDTATLQTAFLAPTILPLLVGITADPQRAKALAAALEDWQDSDNDVSSAGAEQAAYPAAIRVRNSTMQDLSELSFIKGFTPEIINKLKPYVTLFPKRYQNMYAMPAQLLQFYLAPVQLQQVISERERGVLTPDRFTQITGIEQDEFNSFAPSKGLQLHFTVDRKGVKLSRQFSVTLAPTAEEPLQFWDYYKTKYADPNVIP